MVYWIPVDNWADADGEGVADDGQVNEVVVDVEVVDANVEVTEGALSDEDGKSWSGAADESMLSVGGLEEEVPVWEKCEKKINVTQFHHLYR